MRITHSAKTFQRAYDETWTPEIFVVSQGFHRQGIKKYRLEDLDGEEIKGMFYEQELQVVTYNPDTAFAVEREIRSVGVGRNRQILVKWAKEMLWLPATRNELDEICMYITDAKGDIPSLKSCKLYCSLLFSEYKKT